MKTLLDDYKRRLETVNKILKETDNTRYPINYTRLITKASCYRTLINEFERIQKHNEQ